MCPWPFGGNRRAQRPDISSPINLSFSSSVPELDRVSVHAFALGDGATGYDLVNAYGLHRGISWPAVTPAQIEAVKRRIQVRKLDHLHFSWDSVLPEISVHGGPRGNALGYGNPYAQHWGEQLVKQGFAGDRSPIFVSTLQYQEAASFFGPMNMTWEESKFYPVVLGLRDYPITGVAGLTQTSSHAIESGHIRTVFAPTSRWAETQTALMRKPHIAVEEWPRALADGVATPGRVNAAMEQAIRDVAEFSLG